MAQQGAPPLERRDPAVVREPCSLNESNLPSHPESDKGLRSGDVQFTVHLDGAQGKELIFKEPLKKNAATGVKFQAPCMEKQCHSISKNNAMPMCKKQTLDSFKAETFPRIQRVERGWRKRAEPVSKNPWRPVLRVVTTLIPWPILRLTATTGDVTSVRTEAERLQAWRKAGLPVPELLEVTPEHILLADVGKPLRNWLRTESDPGHRLDAVQLAAINLGKIHRSGFCHGRPFLKDIVYDGSQITFIDLEEEPEKIMSLATAQARDLMLFIMSCTASLGDSHPFKDLRAIINVYWQTNPCPQVRRVLQRNVCALYWLTLPLRLCPQRILGRDARQVLRGLAVLQQCSR